MNWMHCPAGATGKKCTDTPGEIFTWKKADHYCKSLGKKWRLPTISELISLRSCQEGKSPNPLVNIKECQAKLESKQHGACKRMSQKCNDNDGFPVIDSEKFPTTELAGFWSGTAEKSNKEKAWGLNFYQGHVQTASKTNKIYVRCISSL